MNIEEIRAQLISTVWQAVVQSKVDLSSIPPEGQEKLVSTIANNVLMQVDNLLDGLTESETDTAQAQPPVESGQPDLADDDSNEEVLWKGRPFLSIVEFYTLTDERLKIVRGLLSRDVENFELIRFQDIDFGQNLSERALGIGDIKIRGHDASQPTVIIRNVRNPEQVYEILRKAWLEARKRHGLQFREYM